jgi:hypothetical protein
LSHWHVGPSIDLRVLDMKRTLLLSMTGGTSSSPLIPSVHTSSSRVPSPRSTITSQICTKLGRTMASQHAPLDKSGTHPGSSPGDPASRWRLRPAWVGRSPSPLRAPEASVGQEIPSTFKRVLREITRWEMRSGSGFVA